MSQGQNGKFYSKHRVRLNNEHSPMTKMVLFEEMKFRISVILGGNWSAPKARAIFKICEVGVGFSSRHYQYTIL